MEPAGSPTSSPESSKAKTFSVVALLVLVGVADLIAYIYGVLRTPKYSPWTTATLLNMVFGAVFAVCYLVIRNGPAVLFIPSRVFAFLWILIANFVLLWYIAYMIICENDVVLALLPYSDGRLSTMVPMRTDHDRKKSQLIVVFSCLVVLVLVWVGVRAAMKESFAEEWESLTSNKWLSFIYTDCVTGLVFVVVYIAAREGVASISAMLWIIVVLVLGNLVTFAYIATMAVQAVRHDMPFSHVMLSTIRSLRSTT